MRRFFCLTVKADANPEAAWQECCAMGFENLYSIQEDSGHVQLYGEITSKNPILKDLPSIAAMKEIAPPSINWESQWAAFGKNYSEGYVQISLPNAVSIRLKPGPGFGDLSHPTTQLMIEMMTEKIRGQTVCDVGCGSGILSIASVALGAKEVDAIDIDPQALHHAQENASLNSMKHSIHFYLPENYSVLRAPGLVLMNMIPAEQKTAWQSLTHLHSCPRMIVSGILQEKREGYLTEWKELNRVPVEEMSLDGWLAFELKIQE
jgi:ribosomal protein L11 methyltransferase